MAVEMIPGSIMGYAMNRLTGVDEVPGLQSLRHIIEPPAGIDWLLWLAGLYFAIAVVSSLVELARSVSMAAMGQRAMLSLRRTLFDHVQRLPLRFFDRYPVGRLVTRLGNDIESASEMFSAGLVALIADLVTMAGFAAVLFYFNWRLAACAMAVVPAMAPTAHIAVVHILAHAGRAAAGAQRRSGRRTRALAFASGGRSAGAERAARAGAAAGPGRAAAGAERGAGAALPGGAAAKAKGAGRTSVGHAGGPGGAAASAKAGAGAALAGRGAAEAGVLAEPVPVPPPAALPPVPKLVLVLPPPAVAPPRPRVLAEPVPVPPPAALPPVPSVVLVEPPPAVLPPAPIVELDCE
jgi:hypothetical protein